MIHVPSLQGHWPLPCYLHVVFVWDLSPLLICCCTSCEMLGLSLSATWWQRTLVAATWSLESQDAWRELSIAENRRKSKATRTLRSPESWQIHSVFPLEECSSQGWSQVDRTLAGAARIRRKVHSLREGSAVRKLPTIQWAPASPSETETEVSSDQACSLRFLSPLCQTPAPWGDSTKGSQEGFLPRHPGTVPRVQW